MLEIIFYGRGGQGCLVASKILASTLFRAGKQVQAFPAFGGERRGAPVKAFLRADEKAIRRRSMIYQADYALVFDETLLEEMPIQEEIKDDALLLMNSARPAERFENLKTNRVRTIGAKAIARDLGLGETTSPIINTIMLGALARFDGLFDIKWLLETIPEYIEAKPEKNIVGALRAFKETAG